MFIAIGKQATTMIPTIIMPILKFQLQKKHEIQPYYIIQYHAPHILI